MEPIENADNIELVTVLGWKVVTKKGEFQENDLCIYVEIDSILPEIPIFEFIEAAEKTHCFSCGMKGGPPFKCLL